VHQRSCVSNLIVTDKSILLERPYRQFRMLDTSVACKSWQADLSDLHLSVDFSFLYFTASMIKRGGLIKGHDIGARGSQIKSVGLHEAASLALASQQWDRQLHLVYFWVVKKQISLSDIDITIRIWSNKWLNLCLCIPYNARAWKNDVFLILNKNPTIT